MSDDGKLDARIDVPVTSSFKGRVARVARLKGYGNSSEWSRRHLESALLHDEQEIDAIVAETSGDRNWRSRG